MITHSRGGLVLRNLVERAAAFGALSKKVQIGQVVLVASPNEGTPLATPRRWEDTVGWIANLLELFPDSPFTTGPRSSPTGWCGSSRHLPATCRDWPRWTATATMIRELQGPPGPPADRYSALVANCNPAGNVLQAAARRRARSVLRLGERSRRAVGRRMAQSTARDPRSSPAPASGASDRAAICPGDSVTHVNIFAQPGAAAVPRQSAGRRRAAADGGRSGKEPSGSAAAPCRRRRRCRSSGHAQRQTGRATPHPRDCRPRRERGECRGAGARSRSRW